jgi:hypothetical protein
VTRAIAAATVTANFVLIKENAPTAALVTLAANPVGTAAAA